MQVSRVAHSIAAADRTECTGCSCGPDDNRAGQAAPFVNNPGPPKQSTAQMSRFRAFDLSPVARLPPLEMTRSFARRHSTLGLRSKEQAAKEQRISWDHS